MATTGSRRGEAAAFSRAASDQASSTPFLRSTIAASTGRSPSAAKAA